MRDGNSMVMVDKKQAEEVSVSRYHISDKLELQ